MPGGTEILPALDDLQCAVKSFAGTHISQVNAPTPWFPCLLKARRLRPQKPITPNPGGSLCRPQSDVPIAENAVHPAVGVLVFPLTDDMLHTHTEQEKYRQSPAIAGIVPMIRASSWV
jgi:hypothetical protein